MLAHAMPFWDNQWIADIATGIIVTLFLGAIAWATKIKRMLDGLNREVRPNGGDTLSSGDTVSRIETKVDALIVTVASQKGHTDTVEREMFRRVTALETREQVAHRIEGEH